MALVVKNLPASVGVLRDSGLIPGLGSSSGGGQGTPLQCSSLRMPMDRGTWQAVVHIASHRVEHAGVAWHAAYLLYGAVLVSAA